MSNFQLSATRVFDGRDEIGPATIEVAEGRVVAVRTDERAHDDTTRLDDVLVTPGLVDVHSHGGGAAAFGIDPARVLATHLARGTTTMVASLVTQSLDDLEFQVRMLAPMVHRGELAGIHLEGPWLAPGKKGAHPLALLRTPAVAELNRLLDASVDPQTGRCAVRMVTLAPELEGGIEAVRLLTDRGVVAAIGHTEADLTCTRAAVEAGATGATHLFNAMPSLGHRSPGPILALAADERVWLELIVDGVHVDLGLIAEMFKRYGDRVVLVTDAMAAAGQPDGDYMLGDLAVSVVNGVARLVEGGSIAGSTLTLDAAVRNAIGAGVDPTQALRAATSLPASYLDILEVGWLRPGAPADLVAWTLDWQVAKVMHRGAWVD